MADEFTNVTMTKDGTSVEIDTINDEEIFNKTITPIQSPQSSNNWSSGKKDTKILDLLRIQERINIDGTLSTTSTDTASTKKANLKVIFKS